MWSSSTILALCTVGRGIGDKLASTAVIFGLCCCVYYIPRAIARDGVLISVHLFGIARVLPHHPDEQPEIAVSKYPYHHALGHGFFSGQKDDAFLRPWFSNHECARGISSISRFFIGTICIYIISLSRIGNHVHGMLHDDSIQ